MLKLPLVHALISSPKLGGPQSPSSLNRECWWAAGAARSTSEQGSRGLPRSHRNGPRRSPYVDSTIAIEGVGGRGRGAPRACRESGASEDGGFTVCVARSPFSPLCSALSCAIPERCRVPAAAGERLAAAPGRATPRISAVAAAGGEAPARSNGSAVSGDGADSRRRPPSSPGFVLRALRLPPYPGPCPASRLCIR